MEDVVAAVVFFTAFSTLLLFTAASLSPFLYTKTVASPHAPSEDTPSRVFYVYNVSKRDGFDLIVAEHGDKIETPPTWRLVAVFRVYPGGYDCVLLTEPSVKIGDDPYTGLWCPPPLDVREVEGCTPKGLTSRGRWLLIEYVCS
ncbi:MAG: hypothetical protein QXU59_02670 [Pyrobaculum sp.]